MTRTIAALLLIASLAPAAAQPAGYPPAPPPPGPADRIPLPPASPVPLEWQPGHWDWSGQTYVWRYGRYVAAAGHSNQWLAGTWARAPGGWTWVPAHWL